MAVPVRIFPYSWKTVWKKNHHFDSVIWLFAPSESSIFHFILDHWVKILLKCTEMNISRADNCVKYLIFLKFYCRIFNTFENKEDICYMGQKLVICGSRTENQWRTDKYILPIFIRLWLAKNKSFPRSKQSTARKSCIAEHFTASLSGF